MVTFMQVTILKPVIYHAFPINMATGILLDALLVLLAATHAKCQTQLLF